MGGGVLGGPVLTTFTASSRFIMAGPLRSGSLAVRLVPHGLRRYWDMGGGGSFIRVVFWGGLHHFLLLIVDFLLVFFPLLF